MVRCALRFYHSVGVSSTSPQDALPIPRELAILQPLLHRLRSSPQKQHFPTLGLSQHAVGTRRSRWSALYTLATSKTYAVITSVPADSFKTTQSTKCTAGVPSRRCSPCLIDEKNKKGLRGVPAATSSRNTAVRAPHAPSSAYC